MCSINHDKKAIFIHIPKTGGSYIAEILQKNYGTSRKEQRISMKFLKHLNHKRQAV